MDALHKLETPQTLQAAIEFFADPDRCHAYLIQSRWPDGRVICPRCNRQDVIYLANQRRFKCKGKHSGAQFSVKVGTVMEDSPLPLKHWLLAMWMISNCKNGVSSYEIGRALGITQKSAWFLLHRIRLAMQDKNTGGKLGGEVEVDESYIGGRSRNMNRGQRARHLRGGHKRNAWAGKAAVMALLERHPEKGKSRVRAFPVEGIRKYAMTERVKNHVEDGSTVYTDQLKSYANLPVYYDHQVINHAESYAEGQVHTNGLENFWSLLKRGIRGTYVSVEPFHLFRYLDEQAMRFNERSKNDGNRFDQTLKQILGRRVTYEQLTGGPSREEAGA